MRVASQDEDSGAGADVLSVVSDVSLSPRLRELHLSSPALGVVSPVRVLAPEQHTRRGSELPVLWLLHGGDDDYRSWTESGDAERLTAGLDLVVVMPDNGPGGWYTNWHRSDSAAGAQQWETYHLEELRGWVEREYPTRIDRAGRAIVGLSMGGFGAMSYAARHPDLFGFAAAFSGAVDIVDPHLGIFADALAQLNGGEPGCIWGDRELELMNWRAHNPVDLAANLRSLRLELRSGNGQPGGRHGGAPDLIETTVHQTSCTLHSTLEELGIDHVWDDYGPGDHSWPYWIDDLERTLPAVVETAQDPPPLPERLEYVSYEPRFSVWGWSVELERDEAATTHFEAGDHDVSLVGTGSGSLSTPALFEPGAVVQVGTNRGEVEVTADLDGRIEIPFEIGGSVGSRFDAAWG